MEDRGAGRPGAPVGRRSTLLVLFACAGTVLAATQGAVQQLLSGPSLDYRSILEWRVLPVLIWVAAAPSLIEAARAIRRTTRGSFVQALGAYAALGAGWIVVSNVLMRLPGAMRGEALAPLLGDTVRGVVEYGPGAAALYVGLVSIGLRTGPSPVGAPNPDPTGMSASTGRPPALDAIPLAIPDGVRIHMVARSDVRWVEADGDRVRIHTAEKTYGTRATLSAYERELEPDGFVRLHRSALVHPRAIKEIQRLYRGDHVAILHDGAEVRIPRTRGEVIDALLSPIGRLRVDG